jgi:hypothetical protein
VVRLFTTTRAALHPEYPRLESLEFCACTPQCGASFYKNQDCATPR